MAYEVTARRWRPQEFDRVIGQDHVTTTLKNAIQSGHIAHAYLFTGPRGVGKTTTARILAKALNCVNGPTVTPCNVCSFCKEIAEGRSVDVLEIDGASNNKVEQIRTHLLESVKYTPSQGKHKIYIIDEVHMLTKEAFNALLKTLEEPPSHVYFIFATTDPQKVLPTIVSRCQRFDFRRIAGRVMVDHLAMIAEQSGYDIEQNALAIIARRADGSLRDAESLFDQVVAFGGASLSARDVASVLGLVEQDIYFDLIDRVAASDIEQGLRLMDTIIHQGYNIDEIALGILEHLRNLLMVKAAPNTPDLLDTAAVDLDRYSAQAEQFATEDLLRLARLATDMEEAIKRSALPKVQLEMGVARMIRLEPSTLLTDVLNRLSEMAQRLDDGTTDFTPEAPAKAAPKASTAAVPENQSETPPIKTQQRSSPAPPEAVQTATAPVSVQAATIERTIKPEPVPAPEKEKSSVSDLNFSEVTKRWPGILERIKQQRIALGNFLAAAMVAGYQDKVVTLAFDSQHEFHKQQAEKSENKKTIQEEFTNALGVPVRIICAITDTPPSESNPSPPPSEPLPEVNASTVVRQDPAVKRLLDAFDGQIMGN